MSLDLEIRESPGRGRGVFADFSVLVILTALMIIIGSYLFSKIEV